ncbi:hypothetical protein RB213_002091 [Colletotrichum asianum]
MDTSPSLRRGPRNLKPAGLPLRKTACNHEVIRARGEICPYLCPELQDRTKGSRRVWRLQWDLSLQVRRVLLRQHSSFHVGPFSSMIFTSLEVSSRGKPIASKILLPRLYDT